MGGGVSVVALSDASLGFEPWRAIPRFFEHEFLSIFSRQPFSPVKATLTPYKRAIRNSLIHPTAIKDEFKSATYTLFRHIKDRYGHHSMGHREDGQVIPIHEDIDIASFHPGMLQKRKNAAGHPQFCNVTSEDEIWKELKHYRRQFDGVLSDDDDVIPRVVLVWKLTKAQLDGVPDEVRKQTSNRRYHALGTKAANCWTIGPDVLRGLRVRVPEVLEKYHEPVEITKAIRNETLVKALEGFRSSIAIVTRDEMARAVESYRAAPENFHPRTSQSATPRLAFAN